MAGNLKRVDEMMILSYSVSLYGLVFFSPNDLYQAQNVTIFGISGKYCDYSKKNAKYRTTRIKVSITRTAGGVFFNLSKFKKNN